MPFVWLKNGDGVAEKTLYDRDGLCSLRHLELEKFSIALDSMRGFMEDGCQFSVTRFREETSEERGSTADLAIVVTGTRVSRMGAVNSVPESRNIIPPPVLFSSGEGQPSYSQVLELSKKLDEYQELVINDMVALGIPRRPVGLPSAPSDKSIVKGQKGRSNLSESDLELGEPLLGGANADSS